MHNLVWAALCTVALLFCVFWLWLAWEMWTAPLVDEDEYVIEDQHGRMK